MIRLFIGLEIPAPVKDQLLGLKSGIPGARWQREDQLHLTLKFIGDVEEPVARDCFAALLGLRAHMFDVEFAGAGVFGEGRNAHRLWTGVKEPGPLLYVHEKLDRALMGAGITPERRRFHPHVTLARLSRPELPRVSQFVAENQGFVAEAFTATEFTLFRSYLAHTGSVYEALERFPL